MVMISILLLSSHYIVAANFNGSNPSPQAFKESGPSASNLATLPSFADPYGGSLRAIDPGDAGDGFETGGGEENPGGSNDTPNEEAYIIMFFLALAYGIYLRKKTDEVVK